MNLEQAMRNFRRGTSVAWVRAQSLTMPSGAPQRMTLRMKGKDGKPARLPELLVKYKKACRAGWKCKKEMQGVSPPGFKKTVEEMKDNPDIDNPWSLAWWMSQRGYTPGGSKDKGK